MARISGAGRSIGLPFACFVALRFLREGRAQTLLILAAVTGGVAVLIFLTQLITQLQASLIERTLGSQAHVTIRPAKNENRPVRDPAATTSRVEPRVQRLRTIDQWQAVLPWAGRQPGVAAAAAVVSGPAFALRNEANKSVALLGVTARDYTRIVNLPRYMVAGRFAPEGTQIVIGTQLARDLAVGVGDSLRLRTAAGRDQVLTIAGVFDIGARDPNQRWVFMSMPLAQSLLDLPGGATEIYLRVDALFSASDISQRIGRATGLDVDSWMESNAQLLAGLRNQSTSNSLIRGFVVLIVALGIASVLVVSVVQKQREIGILRAMGVTRRRILAVFLLQGGMVGFVGALAGCGLAWGLLSFFARVFRNADASRLFTPDFAPGLFAGAVALAVVVGMLAAWLPARRAAGLDPVEAIRS